MTILTRRILVLGLAGLVLLSVTYSAWILGRAYLSVPSWDGSYELPGLDSPVEIVRDKSGTPHLFASTPSDLYFAEGFVHAQDRLWQMSLARQNASGRLSEWFGSLALPTDRYNRNIGYHLAVERQWEAFPEPYREALVAYTAGVNAWLNHKNFKLPPEMVFLHLQPEPWRPQDCFLVYSRLYEMLARYGNEVAESALRKLNAPPQAGAIYAVQQQPVPAIISPSTQTQPTSAKKEQAFSNSYTLSGRFTASGKPLLANDPQLSATMPNTWYLIHLSQPDSDVVGVSIPGVPGVALGRNRAVAWGATNAMLDTRDIMFVELNPEAPEQYRYNANTPWLPLTLREESYRVRFGSDFTETVRTASEGVLLPPGLGRVRVENTLSRTPVFRVDGVDRETSIAALLGVNQAKDVTSAVDAISLFSGPSLNFSVADTAGNIAYVTGGRIPKRATAHATRLDYYPKDSNAREALPFAQNPRDINPRSGRIVAANQKITDDSYPYYLNDSYAPPSRARRIHELLDQQPQHSIESLTRIQQDNLSPVARTLVPLMLKRTRPSSDLDQRLIRHLAEWDFRFDLDSPAPTIFLTWHEMLSRRVFKDELAGLSDRARNGLYYAMELALSEQTEWCNDIATNATESCAELLSASLKDAGQELVAAYGAEPSGWSWGFVHQLSMPHLGLAEVPILGALFSRSTETPAALEGMFTSSLDLSHAPAITVSTMNSSFQAIYDLANLDGSRFMLAGGASGHFASPFYNNLTRHWIAGGRFKIPTLKKDVQSIAALTLTAQGD